VSAFPPGPRGVGVRFVGRASAGGLLSYLAEVAKRYGSISSFRLGSHRIVVVDDADLVEELLVTRQHEFVRASGATILRELVGEGLLTTDDPAHVARRRIMQPAFHRARVARYATTIVTETERVIAAWNGKPLDVGAEMAQVTLAAVGATLFGADLRAEAGRIAVVLARVLARGTSLGPLLAIASPALGPLHRMFPNRSSILFPRERAELDAIVGPIVRRRRDAASGDDLLSLLLEARDGSATLDEEAVRNEVVMLILAGHETTANALAWTWYLLASHPQVEAKLHAEVDGAIGGRPPNLDDVPKLRFTANVFEESLRLFPPAGAFARVPLAATELGGYAIPKGASIFVSPFVTQRNPRYFEDPLAFVPERWEGKPPPRFAHFPFGGGSKTCIGEPFARMEAVLAIATIAARFSLRRVERGSSRRPSRVREREAKPSRPFGECDPPSPASRRRRKTACFG
jgi:cytochrome P450